MYFSVAIALVTRQEWSRFVIFSLRVWAYFSIILNSKMLTLVSFPFKLFTIFFFFFCFSFKVCVYISIFDAIVSRHNWSRFFFRLTQSLSIFLNCHCIETTLYEDKIDLDLPSSLSDFECISEFLLILYQDKIDFYFYFF